MPEPNQPGAKPAQAAPAKSEPIKFEQNYVNDRDRRDKFFLAVATASLTRQNGRTPLALAKECWAFTDAFLAALDAGA